MAKIGSPQHLKVLGLAHNFGLYASTFTSILQSRRCITVQEWRREVDSLLHFTKPALTVLYRSRKLPEELTAYDIAGLVDAIGRACICVMCRRTSFTFESDIYAFRMRTIFENSCLYIEIRIEIYHTEISVCITHVCRMCDTHAE